MPEPDVSVVLASDGRSPTIEHQLAALAKQEGAPPFEVALVANRANGALDAVASRWADHLAVSLVVADDKAGASYARNTGIAAVRGTKLLFLDDDDIVSPNYVAAMVAALDRHPAVGARMELERLNPGWRTQVRIVGQTGKEPPDPFVFVYGAALGVRREVLDRIGPFDESLGGIASEDVEWAMRFRRDGGAFGYVPDAVVHYRLRTGYHDLAVQGYRYGRGGQIVTPGWIGWSAWMRSLLAPLRLVAIGPGPGKRRRGVFLLGRRLGVARERRRGRAGS